MFSSYIVSFIQEEKRERGRKDVSYLAGAVTIIRLQITSCSRKRLSALAKKISICRCQRVKMTCRSSSFSLAADHAIFSLL